MSEENPKPVNVDPRCIQEALRMFLQPIKNDDLQLDFYTMYKRETVEYDTEYMQKYNEDLNTTLIFAGLFSAVSSAFVIDIQSKLGPDSAGRSEVYLRAILFALNRSTAPDEDSTGPPVWNGPPTEIITTSNLLYASLLMSLLAAFVAMLGKQWLNRYLRHAGGSMVERCGDRQRKFDGLEKWPFRPFIESLPIILQIALLLLTCGLSRYVWSVNTSVAPIVISFTVLGALFYVGIVVAGTSSYECPFQTPASMFLRYFRDSGTTQEFLASLSPPKLISLIHATWRDIQKLVFNLTPPTAISLISAAWMDACQGTISAVQRVHEVVRFSLSREISLHNVVSGIRSTTTRFGHQIIILLLRIDRAFGNTKYKLSQRIRRLRYAGLLPVTTRDAHHQPPLSRDGPDLRVCVWNLERIRRRNADNARCVCWVLRNITDPEAIDSAIRLAGMVRWFDGDPDLDPPFDLIVSVFETCFDSTKQLCPGMRDRAYFSARAILQINTGARAQSHERASKYPIPAVSPNSFQYNDPDLHHIISMLECNFPHVTTLNFPRGDINTHGHLLWVSNLFVDVIRVDPSPILKSYESYLSAAATNHTATIANILLMWYVFLGGSVEEGAFWAVDKSDSLETILSHLSTRMTNVIADEHYHQHLYYLLEFLVAWEKRPTYLTSMAYHWCYAISEAAERHWRRETPIIQPRLLGELFEYELQFHQFPQDGFSPSMSQLRLWGLREFLCDLPFKPGLGLRFRIRSWQQDLGSGLASPLVTEREFSQVGTGCNLLRLGDTSLRTRRPGQLEDPTPLDSAHLLSILLEIGFRLAEPGRDQPALHLKHTFRHDKIFEIAFSSYDDEVIADAVCAWIADGHGTPPGSLMHQLTKRVERDTPFSPRLRRVSIRAIECIWSREVRAAESEVVQLLNRLDVVADDVLEKCEWERLLVDVICSQTADSLSTHYWRLLDSLAVPGTLDTESSIPSLCSVSNSTDVFDDVGSIPDHADSVSDQHVNPPLYYLPSRSLEVARSLEEAEDWEKLETWIMVAWRFPLSFELRKGIGRVTRELLFRRPSALPRFEDQYKTGPSRSWGTELRRICDEVRKDEVRKELWSFDSLTSQSIHVQSHVLLPFVGDDTF